MTKFTPEYIAKCRGVWSFPEAKALDEIERSHDMIERLIEAGEKLAEIAIIYNRHDQEIFNNWIDIRDEWKEQK